MANDDLSQRIEDTLRQALERAVGPSAPPRLAQAFGHAVFPGGQRIRPRLTLSVARACGDDRPLIANAAAAAIELLHCASLVHDDLPCFDDADLRRGKPSVHLSYGEPLAVLTGDGLIVLAFETAALAASIDAVRSASLSLIVARAVGMPHGIVAGQGWESEPAPEIELYQRAKTGSLFAGAAMAGAVAAGCAADPWASVGHRLGEAYQFADDLRDVLCRQSDIGKPVGRDAALARPNAVRELGVEGAASRLMALVEEAAEEVPDCVGASALRAQIRQQASRFLPKEAARHAA